MKAYTVEQYKIFDYLSNNFNLINFEIEIISRNEVKVIDENCEFLIFKYENGTVIY
ncbi:hypothetical protein GNF86_14880 [Clostridium perfringens]|jgi:hypothetical protein